MTEKELRAELKQCNTLNEMWSALNKFYNLDTNLGAVSKNIVAAQLAQRVEVFANMLSIKKRTNEKA